MGNNVEPVSLVRLPVGVSLRFSSSCVLCILMTLFGVCLGDTPADFDNLRSHASSGDGGSIPHLSAISLRLHLSLLIA